jgi:hypothetical protein
VQSTKVIAGAAAEIENPTAAGQPPGKIKQNVDQRTNGSGVGVSLRMRLIEALGVIVLQNYRKRHA